MASHLAPPRRPSGAELAFDGIDTPARAALILELIANTDCTYLAALIALQIWDRYGFGPSDRCWDRGETARSLKVGSYDSRGESQFIVTLC